MPPWNLGKAVIFAVTGLALIAASVAIAIFLPSKENVTVAAGGMAQYDMITDDPSGANLSMILLAYANLNCALVLILMAFIFPEVARFKKPAVIGLALIAGIAISSEAKTRVSDGCFYCAIPVTIFCFDRILYISNVRISPQYALFY